MSQRDESHGCVKLNSEKRKQQEYIDIQKLGMIS